MCPPPPLDAGCAVSVCSYLIRIYSTHERQMNGKQTIVFGGAGKLSPSAQLLSEDHDGPDEWKR